MKAFPARDSIGEDAVMAAHPVRFAVNEPRGHGLEVSHGTPSLKKAIIIIILVFSYISKKQLK